MPRRKPCPQTNDLFADGLFPVRAPAEPVPAMDFNVRIAQAISRALKESPLSRAQIAASMSEMLGEDVSAHMLNAYASPAREEHRISLVRFKALARVTGCVWLWEAAVKGDGLTLLQGEEALLAQIGAVEQQKKALDQRLKELKSRPAVALRPSRLASQVPQGEGVRRAKA
jgi:hypothetical protein